MTDQTEATEEENTGFNPQAAAERLRKTAVQPSPIFSNLSPDLGPNIPEVVEQIEPARQEEEKRLLQEQQERTRLRNLGIISQPTDLLFTDSRGRERTIKADVDLRHGFIDGKDVRKYDTKSSIVNGRALFAFNLPRKQDGTVGNEDGSVYTMPEFVNKAVIPLVEAQLGGVSLNRFVRGQDQDKRKLLSEYLSKTTFEILRNNRNVLEYFRENDPENLAKFIKKMEKLGVVVSQDKFGRKIRAGEEARVSPEITVTLPTDPITFSRYVNKTFALPQFLTGGRYENIVLDDPFNQKTVDRIEKYNEGRISNLRTFYWHPSYFAGLLTEMASGVTGAILPDKEGKITFVSPGKSRLRALTDFAEGPFGQAFGLTPKKLGKLANVLPLKSAFGYENFTDEELNNPNLTFSDITGQVGETVSDVIMHSLVKNIPAAYGYSPEDIDNLDEIMQEKGREADYTVTGGKAVLNPETKEVVFEGKALGDDVSDIFGGATVLFGINAASMAALRGIATSTVRRSLRKGAEKGLPKEDTFSIFRNGKINRAELTKGLKALDEGKDVAGLGAFNLRVKIPGTRIQINPLKEAIIKSVNHPMRTAAGMQLFYAASIGVAEGTQELMYAKGDGIPRLFGYELKPEAATGFTILNTLVFPIVGFSVGSGLLKAGFNKTIGEAFTEVTNPEFFEMLELIRQRAPEASFGKRSKVLNKLKQAMEYLRDEEPENFATIIEYKNFVNNSNRTYLENGLKAGIARAELEEDIRLYNEMTAKATAFLPLASAAAYFENIKIGTTVIKGGITKKQIADVTRQAADEAMATALTERQALDLAQTLSKLLRRIEQRAGPAEGVNREMLAMQEQLAQMLRVTIGGIDPKKLTEAMRKVFNVAEDFKGKKVDLKEATDVVKNALGSLETSDANLFAQKMFIGNEDKLFGDFQQILDDALPQLRENIERQRTFIDQFNQIPRNNFNLYFGSATASPLRPKLNERKQYDLILDAFKRAKDRSDKLYEVVYSIAEQSRRLDARAGEDILDRTFDLAELIDTADEARKNLDFGVESSKKLTTLINSIVKNNEDLRKFLQLKRNNPERIQYINDILGENANRFDRETQEIIDSIDVDNILINFQRTHQLRSDIQGAILAEYKKGAPDGGTINLLGQALHQIDDGIETFLVSDGAKMNIGRDIDLREAFENAQSNYRNNVAGLFFNSRVIKYAKEEKINNLFEKIFAAGGPDGQRATFERMFPTLETVQAQTGIQGMFSLFKQPDPKRGEIGDAKRRELAIELLRDQMTNAVMGNKRSMSTEEFLFALREAATKQQSGLFGLPEAGPNNILSGGFLDLYFGGEVSKSARVAIKEAEEYLQYDSFLPLIDKNGAVNTNHPKINLASDVQNNLSNLAFLDGKFNLDKNELDRVINDAVQQINVVELDKVDPINRGYWNNLARQNSQEGTTDSTIKYILGDGLGSEGGVAADRYRSLLNDMKTLVGDDQADTYKQLLNRGLLDKIRNEYLARTKALIQLKSEVEPETTITQRLAQQDRTVKENISARTQFWIDREELWIEAFGEQNATSVGHLMNMAAASEQPVASTLRFAETVSKMSANGALSRAWGVQRGVVSLRYVGSEFLLRSMFSNQSEMLVRMLSTPNLSNYLMDAVMYGDTPPKIQRYFKTQIYAALSAGVEDSNKANEIREKLDGFYREALNAGEDPVQLLMSMYFTAQNPELAKITLQALQQAAQGGEINLPEILGGNIREGGREFLRPQGDRSTLLNQLRNLGLADE